MKFLNTIKNFINTKKENIDNKMYPSLMLLKKLVEKVNNKEIEVKITYNVDGWDSEVKVTFITDSGNIQYEMNYDRGRSGGRMYVYYPDTLDIFYDTEAFKLRSYMRKAFPEISPKIEEMCQQNVEYYKNWNIRKEKEMEEWRTNKEKREAKDKMMIDKIMNS